MKKIAVIISFLLFTATVNAQTSYVSNYFNIDTIQKSDTTHLICSDSLLTLTFQMSRHIEFTYAPNFVRIDSHMVMITALRTVNDTDTLVGLSLEKQKEVLQSYAQYELDYFISLPTVQVINPSNQWVVNKTGGWFIWYFKVDYLDLPDSIKHRVVIQLFASTIVDGQIITINAPIMTGSNFIESSFIVNDLMEGLIK